MDQGRQLFINSVSSILSLIIQLGIGIFLIPFILHHLTKDLYGIWALTGSFFGYFTLLTLGLNSAVNRYVPMHLVENDWDELNKIVNTTLFFYIACSAIVIGGTIIASINFADWFSIPKEYVKESIWVVLIVGLGLGLMIPLTVFSAVLSGFQRYELQSLSNVTSKVTRAGAIVAFFSYGFGIIALSVITVLTNLLRQLLIALFAWRQCDKLCIHYKYYSNKIFKKMIEYSINSFLYATGGLIQLQACKIIIGRMFGSSYVTEYEMPSFLLLQLSALVMEGTKVMKPATSSLDAQKKNDQIQVLYKLGLKYAFMIVIPNAALLLIYGRELMSLWLGQVPFIQKSIIILFILCIPEMLRNGHSSAFFVIVGLGKHRIFGLTTIISGISSIVTSILIEYFLHLGVYSVAIGFALPNLLAYGIVIPLYCTKTVNLKFNQIFYQAYLSAFLSSLPFILFLLMAKLYFGQVNLIQLLLITICGIIILIISWWKYGLQRSEKDRFLNYICFKSRRVQSAYRSHQ